VCDEAAVQDLGDNASKLEQNGGGIVQSERMIHQLHPTFVDHVCCAVKDLAPDKVAQRPSIAFRGSLNVV